MITPHILGCIFALSGIAACAAEPVLQWETKGLEAPESVVFDTAKKVYYVSNMGTYNTGEKPHDGFISQVGEDGKLIQAHWVDGLDNPKGLALSKGHLFVGDDVYLTEIDVAAGKIVGQYKPDDGPGDFNDCTVDAEGNVYVCSGRLGTVFRLHSGKFEPWVKLDTKITGEINGMRAEKTRLLVGSWSVGLPHGSEELGHLSAIDYQTKAVGRIGTTPICHVDGLEPDGSDGYLISDWLTGEIFHVTSKGEKTLLLGLTRGAADMLYREELDLLLVPMMKEHTLRAYTWKL